MPTTSSGSTPTARPRFCTLKHLPVNADSLNWEHRLLAKLNSHLPEALAPVPALNGSTWFWFHDPRLADPLVTG
jgi:Ser/Thr protein kinase RdoA (MazF antagonist)